MNDELYNGNSKVFLPIKRSQEPELRKKQPTHPRHSAHWLPPSRCVIFVNLRLNNDMIPPSRCDICLNNDTLIIGVLFLPQGHWRGQRSVAIVQSYFPWSSHLSHWCIIKWIPRYIGRWANDGELVQRGRREDNGVSSRLCEGNNNQRSCMDIGQWTTILDWWAMIQNWYYHKTCISRQ